MVRYPLFLAKIPPHWKRVELYERSSNIDTKEPIAEFILSDNLRLKVHHFPIMKQMSHIPPRAQVERWKKQLSHRQELVTHEENVSWGGFFGLHLTASYEEAGEEQTLQAWALQLDSELESALIPRTQEEESYYSQMAGDFTVKIVGPTSEVEQLDQEISSFAHSIHLIQELPEAL